MEGCGGDEEVRFDFGDTLPSSDNEGMGQTYGSMAGRYWWHRSGHLCGSGYLGDVSFIFISFEKCTTVVVSVQCAYHISIELSLFRKAAFLSAAYV